MAEDKDRLTLTIDWPEITLENLSRISNLWADLVQDVSKDVAGRQGGKSGVKWVIAAMTYGSPLQLTALPRPTTRKVTPDIVGLISRSVVDGMNHLNGYTDRPEFFRDSALFKAQKLAKESAPEQDRRIYVSNGHDLQVPVGQNIVKAVDLLFGPTVESLGSIEGRLEGLFTHQARRFYLYDSLTNRQVRCEYGDRVTLEMLLSAYEQRVSVTGTIRSRANTGERLSIRAQELRVFDSDDKLMPTDQILKAWARE